MADSLFNFSGLSSGVQWRDMVDQIMALEARPITKLQTQIAAQESRSKAWGDFRSKIEGLRSATKGLADATAFRAFSSAIRETTAGAGGFSISAGSDAAPGSYAVQVLRTAAREKLGSGYHASLTEALGQAGDFLVNGKAVTVESADTLDDVARKINNAKAGVTASILAVDDRYRLVLTSATTGADGIDLVDGAAGVLRGLGVLDTGTGAIKHATSNGARTDRFDDAATAVATLRGLTAPAPGTGSLTIAGSGAIAVDLATDSLQDIADAINAARDGGDPQLADVTASVVADGDGWRLEIAGSTNIQGDAATLELLGLREGALGATTRSVESDALLGGAATASTTLVADLGAKVGETLTITGTDGAGNALALDPIAIDAGTTLGSLAATIQQAFTDAGRDATVDVVGGRLVVTDSASGESAMSLVITANNEQGGALDFGDMAVARDGYTRRITDGADAEFTVDGVRFTRATNTVSDVIEGSTLTLKKAGELADVTISQDTRAVTDTVKAFVDRFNGVLDWVDGQARYPEGGSKPALHGEAWLRGIRNELKSVMQSVLPAAVTDRARLGEVGIEIQRDGRFTFDASKLEAALADDPTSVERLFGEAGFASTSRLRYIDASDATAEGTWAVNVTQAASQAGVLGTALAQVGGTGDTLVIRDAATGAEYRVALVPATPLTTLAANIRGELARALRERVEASTVFYADALKGAAATGATRLDALFQAPDDGAAAAAVVTAGDVLTISGTGRHGTAFTTEYTVSADDTLEDVRAAIQAEVGDGVTVAIEGGRFVLTEDETGTSALSLSVSSSNADPGALSLGTFTTTVEGRPAARIDAEAVDQGDGTFRLSLTHEDFGAAAGFEVSFGSGTADIGVAAGTYTGLDVVATIGGETVTGAGTILTGPEDTDLDGLLLEYEGTTTGDLGSVTFSRGIGARLDRVFDRLLGSGAASIQARVDAADERVPTLEQRIDDMEARLENRREALIRRFVAMEQAMALAQSQSTWLAGQINALAGYSSGGE